MISFEDIKKANESIKTTNIKGKEYAEVNQRIKAFRMVFPEGSIETDLISNENGVCIFKATIWNGDTILGEGTAYEKENSTFINKTSYIENCETSAVGRALGMAGFGIDTSVASYEEVANAIAQQEDEKTISKDQEETLYKIIVNRQVEKDDVMATLKNKGYNKLADVKQKDYYVLAKYFDNFRRN